MRNGRTRGDRFRSPLRYFRRSRQRKGRFSIPRIASFFLSMVKYVVRPISQQNKNPCKLSVCKDFMVGVTGFEPAASWSRTKRSTELSHTPLSYLIPLFSSPNVESTALRLRSPRSPISSRPHSAASSATGSAASLAYLAEPHPVKLSYYIFFALPIRKVLYPIL